MKKQTQLATQAADRPPVPPVAHDELPPRDATNSTNIKAGRVSADFADRLPEPARSHFRELCQSRDDARALVRSLNERAHHARGELMQAEAQLGYLVKDRRLNGEDDPLVATKKDEIAEIKSEISRLESAMSKRQEMFSERDRLIGNLEKFIRGADRIVALEITEPSRRSKESAEEAIERCRLRVRELRADMNRIESAPVHSDEAKKRAHIKIDAMAERGCPNCLGLIEGEADIEFPKSMDQQLTYGSDNFVGMTTSEHPDAIAVLAWMQKDLMIASIDRQIDLLADDENALTADQRAEKMATARGDLLKNEREEESLIRIQARRGVPIERRPNADPRAVLGIV
jgi:hypothetical protein